MVDWFCWNFSLVDYLPFACAVSCLVFNNFWNVGERMKQSMSTWETWSTFIASIAPGQLKKALDHLLRGHHCTSKGASNWPFRQMMCDTNYVFNLFWCHSSGKKDAFSGNVDVRQIRWVFSMLHFMHLATIAHCEGWQRSVLWLFNTWPLVSFLVERLKQQCYIFFEQQGAFTKICCIVWVVCAHLATKPAITPSVVLACVHAGMILLQIYIKHQLCLKPSELHLHQSRKFHVLPQQENLRDLLITGMH